MNLVIDANRLMAGILKDSTCRKIIFDERIVFFAPDQMIMEITNYQQYLIKKSCLSQKEFNILLENLLSRIEVLTFNEFEYKMKKSMDIMKEIDIDDTPFLAVGLAMKADGIWTEDKHFYKQFFLKVYSTKSLVEILNIKI